MIFRAATTSNLAAGANCPTWECLTDLCHREEGYGVDLKRKARKDYGTTIGFAGRGEMIPNPDTYCEIDPDVVDEFGIPVLRFHFKWSEYELRQAKDMQETFRAIVEMAGGQYLTKAPIDGPQAFGIDWAERSFTKWGRREWGPIRRLRC